MMFWRMILTIAAIGLTVPGAFAQEQVSSPDDIDSNDDGQPPIVIRIGPSAPKPTPTPTPAPKFSAGQLTPDYLESNWMDGETTLSVRHVQKLMDLANKDPETAAILANAKSVLGASTAQQLMGFIEICDFSKNDGILGLAHVQGKEYIESKGASELVKQVTRDHKAVIQAKLGPKEKLVEFRDYPDYVIGDSIERDDICITRDSTTREALVTFVHELTHVANLMPKAEELEFPSKYLDREEYIRKTFVEPGGEFDANYQGYRALIRLDHGRARLPKQLQESFNDKGDLIDKEKFTSYLLDIGYRDLIGKDYRDQLYNSYKTLLERENLLYKVKSERDLNAALNLPPAMRRRMRDSSTRLQAEIDKLEELGRVYQSRLAAEGISVTVTTTTQTYRPRR